MHGEPASRSHSCLRVCTVLCCPLLALMLPASLAAKTKQKKKTPTDPIKPQPQPGVKDDPVHCPESRPHLGPRSPAAFSRQRLELNSNRRPKPRLLLSFAKKPVLWGAPGGSAYTAIGTYREDKPGPCARMTGKGVKCFICKKQTQFYYNVIHLPYNSLMLSTQVNVFGIFVGL